MSATDEGPSTADPSDSRTVADAEGDKGNEAQSGTGATLNLPTRAPRRMPPKRTNGRNGPNETK
jgi:hypothetical protein